MQKLSQKLSLAQLKRRMPELAAEQFTSTSVSIPTSKLESIKKYNLQSLIEGLNPSHIEKLSQCFLGQFTIIEFLSCFMGIVPHAPTQTVYLILGLMELFEEVGAGSATVTFEDLLNYTCNTEQDMSLSVVQRSKKARLGKMAAISDNLFMRMSQIIDKNQHETSIEWAALCGGQIYCLYPRARAISRFTTKCQLLPKIPCCFKKIKNIIQACFYSPQEQAVGILLKDFTFILKAGDSEKVIPISLIMQTSIHYIHSRWVTCDRYGSLSVWDVAAGKVERTIKCKNRIGEICAVRNLIAVVYIEPSFIEFYHFQKGQLMGRVMNSQRFSHSIHYSSNHELLIADLPRVIKLYELSELSDSDSDIELQERAELLHGSAVRCFTELKDRSLLVSVQERAIVRIWSLFEGECLQTLHIKREMIVNAVLDMGGKIGVIGSRIELIQFGHQIQLERQNEVVRRLQVRMSCMQIISVTMNYKTGEMYVLTRQEVRVYNFHTGLITSTWKPLQQIDSLFYAPHLSRVYLGTPQGCLLVYRMYPHRPILERTVSNHTSTIRHFTHSGGLFFTCDTDIHIHDSSWNQLRHITNVDVSFMAVLGTRLATASGDIISLWNYEECTLTGEMQIRSEVTAMCVLNGELIVCSRIGTIEIISLDYKSRLIYSSESGCADHIILLPLKAYANYTHGKVIRLNLPQTNTQVTPTINQRKKITNQKRQSKQIRVESRSWHIDWSEVGQGSEVDGFCGVQYDSQYLLLWKESRIKVWRQSELVGYIDIRKLLPYRWSVRATRQGYLWNRLRLAMSLQPYFIPSRPLFLTGRSENKAVKDSIDLIVGLAPSGKCEMTVQRKHWSLHFGKKEAHSLKTPSQTVRCQSASRIGTKTHQANRSHMQGNKQIEVRPGKVPLGVTSIHLTKSASLESYLSARTAFPSSKPLKFTAMLKDMIIQGSRNGNPKEGKLKLARRPIKHSGNQ